MNHVNEKPPQEVFENQFAQREYFDVAGGRAEVVDIVPEKIKDETPVFFAPGWGCTLDVYEPAIKTLAEKERRVVSLSHPRRGGDIEAEAKKYSPEEVVDKYPTEELRKALNILSVIDQKNIPKVDVVAHSEGAVNATIAALLHPEKFRNIVFFAPAGMIGKDTFSRLAKGFVGQTKRAESLSDMPISEKEKKVGAAALKSVIGYLAENPLRAVKETLEISQSDIHEMIRYLHDKGVGIVVMSGIDDPVFPERQMKKIAKTDMIGGFLTVRGAHGYINEQSEDGMVWAEKMLSALESQRQKGIASGGQKPDLSEEFV